MTEVTSPRPPKPPAAGPAATPATPPAPGPAADGPGKRVGIREIARRANVSVATVSMVLNHNPKITEATARRVRTVMDQVGYQPNRIAQTLSGKYTAVLGVLLPTLRHALADPYIGEILSGIIDKADRLGHKVMIESAKPAFIRSRGHLELFERRFVDGILCVGFGDTHTFLRDFATGPYPAISVNNAVADTALDHVMCDYAGGAEQVMTCLFQLGHERIGLVHGSPTVRSAAMIRDVYRRRMAERGTADPDAMMADGRFTDDGGCDAASRLLEADPSITAVFCGNDKMALGAIHCLGRRGLRVPHDVSVVGFDDIAYGAFLNPSLTTVHLPLHEVGGAACERLINRVRGKPPGHAKPLPTHLVLRESTSLARTTRRA